MEKTRDGPSNVTFVYLCDCGHPIYQGKCQYPVASTEDVEVYPVTTCFCNLSNTKIC